MSSILPFCQPAPRKRCESAIEERAYRHCYGKTNFLVIGMIGSTDWAHSTFGRKIEQAVELRRAGKRYILFPKSIGQKVYKEFS